jgi:putative transposase
MSKRKLSTEQIIGVLKQVEAGRTAAEVAREAGVSQHTIYAWKAKYGGLEVSDAEKLRALREENHRLPDDAELLLVGGLKDVDPHACAGA